MTRSPTVVVFSGTAFGSAAVLRPQTRLVVTGTELRRMSSTGDVF